MPNIKGPNGKVISFPDGTSHADIAAAFNSTSLPQPAAQSSMNPATQVLAQASQPFWGSSTGPLSPDIQDRRNGYTPTLMDKIHGLISAVKQDYNDSFNQQPVTMADIIKASDPLAGKR